MARYVTQVEVAEVDALLARKAREGDDEATSGPATPDAKCLSGWGDCSGPPPYAAPPPQDPPRASGACVTAAPWPRPPRPCGPSSAAAPSGPAGPRPDNGSDPSAPRRSWLASALQESPGEWSIRRIVFALSFLFGCGLCLAALLRGADIGPGVKDLATTIIVAAFAAVGIGRFAEAMDR